MAKVALIEYLVRIMPPENVESLSAEESNEMMDQALAAIEATLGHGRLARMIHDKFVSGIDSLGKKGFTVKVVENE